MRTFTVSLAFVLCLALLPASLAQTDSSPNDSLGSIARRYRAERQLVSLSRAPRAVLDRTDPAMFCRDVATLLQQGKFSDLDRIAARARSTEQAFAGSGEWKLYVFYRAVAGACPGDTLTSSDWSARLDALDKWRTARPESPTAPVALANAFVNFAWQARDAATATPSSDDGRNLFKQRIEQARETLERSHFQAERCPHFYYVMQLIGRAQGWDRGRMNVLFEDALRVQPRYPYFYVQQALAISTLPGGRPAAFAEDMKQRIGGAEGAMAYFQVADALDCAGAADLDRFSWPELQQGAAAMDKAFGISERRLNDFARMAVREHDRGVARRAILRMGENWDQPVWTTREQFEQARAWAFEPAAETLDMYREALGNSAGLRGSRYAGQVVHDFQLRHQAELARCEQRSPDAVTAFSLFLKIGGDGAVAQAVAWPPTSLSDCLLPRIQGQRFAAPPDDGHWVMLQLGTRAFVPSPFDFESKMQVAARGASATRAMASR